MKVVHVAYAMMIVGSIGITYTTGAALAKALHVFTPPQKLTDADNWHYKAMQEQATRLNTAKFEIDKQITTYNAEMEGLLKPYNIKGADKIESDGKITRAPEPKAEPKATPAPGTGVKK